MENNIQEVTDRIQKSYDEILKTIDRIIQQSNEFEKECLILVNKIQN